MPQAGYVRLDAWFYPTGQQSDVFILVNGEVIKFSKLARDISSYPSPQFNPRTIGCGESEAIVDGLVGAPAHTTQGSPAAPQLLFGNVQVQVNYHLVNGGKSGMMVTYSNGKMIGMATL
jgi:hypothetical protein